MRELRAVESLFVSGGYRAPHLDGGGNTAPTYQPPGSGYGPNGDMTLPHFVGWCIDNRAECLGWGVGEHGPLVADWATEANSQAVAAAALAQIAIRDFTSNALGTLTTIPHDEGTGYNGGR